jgi:hypothetical protein
MPVSRLALTKLDWDERVVAEPRHPDVLQLVDTLTVTQSRAAALAWLKIFEVNTKLRWQSTTARSRDRP